MGLVPKSATTLELVRAYLKSRADDSFTAKLISKWKGPVELIKLLSSLNYKVELLGQTGAITVECFYWLFPRGGTVIIQGLVPVWPYTLT